MEHKIINLEELIEKVDQLKKQEKMDLSSDQDLSIAIMNLISIEEHLFFSGAKTGKTEYYDLINDVREVRKNLLKKMISQYEGEVWCISKHLLAASMRLMEVGTKQLKMDRKRDAYELFNQSYQLYCLFWGLNMKLLTDGNLKNNTPDTVQSGVPDQEKEKDKDVVGQPASSKKGIMNALGDFVKKVIDCCLE